MKRRIVSFLLALCLTAALLGPALPGVRADPEPEEELVEALKTFFAGAEGTTGQ